MKYILFAFLEEKCHLILKDTIAKNVTRISNILRLANTLTVEYTFGIDKVIPKKGNNKMGEADLENLFKVYYEINSIKKKHNLLCNFKIDEGSYETAIEFIENQYFHPPISKDWSKNPVIFCPDLLDYHNKIIIEYEEEIGNRRPGAKLAKKGHHREDDFDTKRDVRRAKYYELGGFRVLRIWESDSIWKTKLKNFLLGLDGL